MIYFYFVEVVDKSLHKRKLNPFQIASYVAKDDSEPTDYHQKQRRKLFPSSPPAFYPSINCAP